MSQAQLVEEQLRKMILNMDLGPGERLTERWAETQFHTSRTPIRVALLRLESEGLVMREGRGWMIAPLNVQEIEQLFHYRAVLEAAAMRLLAKRGDAVALDELEAQLDECDEDESREVKHKLGSEFHVRLAQLSGNEFICRGVTDAVNRLSRARWLDTTTEHAGWDEHRELIAALRAGDAERAVKLLEQHLQESRDRLLAVLQDGPRSFRARGVVLVANS